MRISTIEIDDSATVIASTVKNISFEELKQLLAGQPTRITISPGEEIIGISIGEPPHIHVLIRE